MIETIRKLVSMLPKQVLSLRKLSDFVYIGIMFCMINSSSDMPTQANLLVDRMIRALGAAKFAADWKLVTFFIGGNDLCGYCKDHVSFFFFD